MSRLQDLTAHAIVQQQLHRLKERTGHQHRIVKAGAALDVGDARYVARLVEILPERLQKLSHLINENDIVVQIANISLYQPEVRIHVSGATDAEITALRALAQDARIITNSWQGTGHLGHKAEVRIEASSRWFKEAPPSVWVRRFQNAARKMARVDAFLKRFKLPIKQGAGYGHIPAAGMVEFEITTRGGYNPGSEDGASLYPGRSNRKFAVLST